MVLEGMLRTTVNMMETSEEERKKWDAIKEISKWAKLHPNVDFRLGSLYALIKEVLMSVVEESEEESDDEEEEKVKASEEEAPLIVEPLQYVPPKVSDPYTEIAPLVVSNPSKDPWEEEDTTKDGASLV